MSFDYLTLTGLLVTLIYIVILVMLGKNTLSPGHDENFVLELTDEEPYRYGT